MIEQCVNAWPQLANAEFEALPGEFDLNYAVLLDGERSHVLKLMRVGIDRAEIDGQIAAIARCATGTDGPLGNVLKIRPPMTFDVDAANRLVTCLERSLERSGANPKWEEHE